MAHDGHALEAVVSVTQLEAEHKAAHARWWANSKDEGLRQAVLKALAAWQQAVRGRD